MAAESSRIVELRRRIQSDPTSIAFAQLAEEYRRAGNYAESIKTCRTGLARHPGYLSARVTLGRALIETGLLDDGAHEFELVLRSAPDNLAAIRGMAEIHRHKGALESALEYYKRALALARHDPELEETVSQIGRELGTVAAPTPSGMSFAEAHSELLSAGSRMPQVTPKRSHETPTGRRDAPETSQPVRHDSFEGVAAPQQSPLVDFDALLRTLGVPDAAPPPVMERLLNEPAASTVQRAWERREPALDAQTVDPFLTLEQELRAFEASRTDAPAASSPATKDGDATTTAILDELESWLAAIQLHRSARDHHNL